MAFIWIIFDIKMKFMDIIKNLSKQIKIKTLIVGKGSLSDYLIKYSEECYKKHYRFILL